jgi:hypothetical protein
VADPQGGFDITGSHMLDESTSSITINLADAGGSTATINEPVTVTDAALSAGPIALNGFEGVRFSNSVVATFSDANLQAPSTDFTATIDWGNGSSGAGTIVSQGNGMFGVLGSSAYALPGTYPVTVSIQDVGGSKTVVKSSIVVADAPLSVQGRMFQLVEGGVFSGVIATFTDANPLSSAGDFSATIRWSDGTTSAGLITADPQTGFDVSGSHAFPLGTSSISVTITDVRGATARGGSIADVTDAPLSASGAVVVAVEGLAAVNLRVATFVDSDPASSTSKFSASIAWGDGGLTTGTIVPDGTGAGHFVVLGSHTYTESGVFPVTVAVADQGGVVTAAASATYVVDFLVPLTGRLDPASDTGASSTDGVTRVSQPRFSGTAEPNSHVLLFAQRVGQPGTFPVGQALVGPNGSWSGLAGPFSDGAYFVNAIAVDQAGNISSPWTGLMPSGSTGPLVIDTTGPHVLASTLNPRTGQVQVVFEDDLGDLSPQALSKPSLFALAAPGASPLSLTGLSVSPAGPTGLATVTFTVNGSRPLRAGRYVLTILAAGPIDLAGNPLTERVFVPSPPLTGLPPNSYAAQFDTDGRSMSLGHLFGSPPTPGIPNRPGRFGLARVMVRTS